ncbi:hypothetical protein EOM39_01165 [Candidatus Gracilibacteria bacterium]|nr:hypothetical protein [Candidatus Gracilibacteria bacterium]
MFIESVDVVTEKIYYIDKIECDICKKRIDYKNYQKTIDAIKKGDMDSSKNPIFEITTQDKKISKQLDLHFCCKKCYLKWLNKQIEQLSGGINGD